MSNVVTQENSVSIIIEGDERSRKNFLDAFARDNGISFYNITVYDQTVKINDVRAIKKILSIKQGKGERRLIILSQDLTLEAQNALLKTLEELPIYTYIIFSCKTKEQLLPTVISRSIHVTLGQREYSFSVESYREKLETLFESVEKQGAALLSLFLKFAHEVENEDENNHIEQLILAARQLLLGEILENETNKRKRLLLIYSLLKRLQELYPFIIGNNLNKRFAIEITLLESVM